MRDDEAAELLVVTTTVEDEVLTVLEVVTTTVDDVLVAVEVWVEVVAVVELEGGVRKWAVSVIGPFIISLDAFLAPEYDPEPKPAQLENTNPVLAVAWIRTVEPASCQPEVGVVTSPAVGFELIWRRNCFLKLAVSVTGLLAA
jgi:hypothetical protein